ncbi:uncharacterized protein LOC142819034 isoform X1 [Pelodiscus sinensis]|uniref:uncharacterized protein LOC142819034 isoform X1 n=1 Tax=Pelodiscus sinensis TaxID=13735 RepID=UPI003F6D1417
MAAAGTEGSGKMEAAAAAAAANGAGSAGDGPPKGEGERSSQNEKRKEKSVKRGGNRFEPYSNPSKRYRAFITNIPFDVKWQSLKDLVKEKVHVDGKVRCEIVSCLAVQLLIPANAPRGTVKPLHSVCRACHVKNPDVFVLGFWDCSKLCFLTV